MINLSKYDHYTKKNSIVIRYIGLYDFIIVIIGIDQIMRCAKIDDIFLFCNFSFYIKKNKTKNLLKKDASKLYCLTYDFYFIFLYWS
jgi:hypothetical protein